jgi:hypothetical protein
LVALDIDGTLVAEDLVVHERTRPPPAPSLAASRSPHRRMAERRPLPASSI